MRRSSILIPAAMVAFFAVISLVGRRGGEDASESRGAALAATARAGGDTLHVAGVPESVSEFLRNGQAWRAARVMREYLARSRDPKPEAVLLAARAEAGWGGWQRVREYLDGRSWLDEVHGGEGWFWLARALEEDRQWQEAMRAYERFLQSPGGNEDRRRIARLRQGLVLLRLERPDEAARLLEAMRESVPDIAPRVDVLAAEALAGSGDTAAVRRLTTGASEPELRERARVALLRAYESARDFAGARALALRFRGEASSAGERAGYALVSARMALQTGDTAAARPELRTAVREAPASSAARTAADLLVDLGGLAADDRLAVARVYDRQGVNARAAALYRAWLAGNTGSAAERDDVRMQLGRALFDAGEYGEAVAALRPLESAEALHLTGRAEYRRGNRARAEQIFRQTAQRYPGTNAGSEALFLIADLDHDAGRVSEARPVYRQVASDFRGTDRAGLSLMRLAGIAYQAKDYAGAARAWEEYRSSYPSGERWLQATYWTGRAYERAGDPERARERYRAVRERDPLSYYALRASERLGEAFWPVPMNAAPDENAAARRRVEEWMKGVDLLRAAGLHEEAEQEADRWIRLAGDDPALLYPLAEALNERGLTVRGIRIGQRLQRREDRFNPRLLRILYPFPYRPMLEAEAREKKLDPFLVAALIRQESLFKARISSPVGARGLMQVMPETGRTLAAGVGIADWDAELLYQPEINAHLGTVFLSEQMRRWNGSLPSVFSAYNAGPHRVERWQEFPEYADEELFTERIPYRETRDYVKILTRNIALYRGLYGGGDSRSAE